MSINQHGFLKKQIIMKCMNKTQRLGISHGVHEENRGFTYSHVYKSTEVANAPKISRRTIRNKTQITFIIK